MKRGMVAGEGEVENRPARGGYDGAAMNAPDGFGDAFLGWLRVVTELAWAKHKPPSFEERVACGATGVDWQTGTRWLPGFTEAEVGAIEASWGHPFPPDYRLFLRRLRATDRPMVGAGYADAMHMKRLQAPGFYDWGRDRDVIRTRLQWVEEGVLESVQRAESWPRSWGPVPSAAEERTEVARRRLRGAAPLIPLFGHRFLVGGPCRAGNPVLSIMDIDMIVFGSDLRDYLLRELADLIGERVGPPRPDAGAKRIPFWGEWID
jgi:hypothetical protein